MAASLRAIGIERGDRVAIYMPTNYEAIALMLACRPHRRGTPRHLRRIRRRGHRRANQAGRGQSDLRYRLHLPTRPQRPTRSHSSEVRLSTKARATS